VALLDVGILITKLALIDDGHPVHQKALGAATAEALDHRQYTERSTGCLDRQPLYNTHSPIVSVNAFPACSEQFGAYDTVKLSVFDVSTNGSLRSRAER
jgi:hypothetical protein